MDEHEPVSISAVEHYAYCPRQAALIHLEGEWQPNGHTARGVVDHASVDRGPRKVDRQGTPTWMSLPVWHDDLGLAGVCDAVELTRDGPVPVEHKPTLPSWTAAPAAQQVAAQAICLEAMWSTTIDHAYIFTSHDQRRHPIQLTPQLRRETRQNIEQMRELITTRELPPPVRDRRCRHCSLRPICYEDANWDHAEQDPYAPTPLGRW